MSNNLMMFEGNDVEVFELNGQVLFNPKHVAKVLGIKNVNDRIKIYFGEKYGISIESELDEGTCVTIRMPKVKGDEV